MANPDARLRNAITDDNLDGVLRALAEKANPNGTKGQPSLARAIAGITRADQEELANRMEIVKALLNACADPNFEGMTGRTALYEALSRPEFVQVLLDYGARAKHTVYLDLGPDDDGNPQIEQTNLLHTAVFAKAPREVILLLRSRGADINFQDTNETTPLQKAAVQEAKYSYILDALNEPINIQEEDDNPPRRVECPPQDEVMRDGGRRRKTRARKTRRKRTLRRR
jgi:hypothetical protein